MFIPNKHEFECILSLNDNMMTVVLFSVLKALKSNFVIFCTSRQVIVALFDHFFFIAVLLTLYVYFSTFIKSFRAWLVTNFEKHYELAYKLKKMTEFWNIQFKFGHIKCPITNRHDGQQRDSVYISVEMLWYDNCNQHHTVLTCSL